MNKTRYYVLLLSLPLVGCGTDYPAVPVTGTVKLNGKPLEGASVTYAAEPGNSPQTSGAVKTGTDGTYRLVTHTGAGLAPGRYTVYVSLPPALLNPAWETLPDVIKHDHTLPRADRVRFATGSKNSVASEHSYHVEVTAEKHEFDFTIEGDLPGAAGAKKRHQPGAPAPAMPPPDLIKGKPRLMPHNSARVHHYRLWRLTMVFVALALVRSGAAQTPGGPAVAAPEPVALDGPLSPSDASRSFRLEPGLRLELVASEPLVASPVALAFDERGRMYVAENRGYPIGPGDGRPPAGRVALLEDTDADGRMDRRSEFAEGLSYPNGVMPWKGGLIVACAPDVLYLRDTDGDGRADERRTLFTGFATTLSTQHRVSHPTLSIDNWVYLASGMTGGRVTAPEDRGGRAVELTRADFRFRPGLVSGEPADGYAQFGLTFDDFGRRFICYNRVQVRHVVLESRVLRRNPHLASSETVQDCPTETVPDLLKGHGAAARLFPISRNIMTADSHAGTFTAACGLLVFRGEGLPARYKGGAISCDPTGNLVHFDLLEPNGVTFAARRAREGVEFLASTDNWFRPVFLAHGPDGALYVADMYRKTIEHPDYLPAEIRKRTDFESGKNMGRIWRVIRDDRPAADLWRLRRVNLGGASTSELCAVLRDADGWRRDTAHRLLLERRDRAAIDPLRLLAFDPQSPPATVVHALRLLEAIDSVPDDLGTAGSPRSFAPERFARYTPALREEVLAAQFSRACHLPGLLSALEDGRIPAVAVDALRRRQLTRHRDSEVRRRAQAIFGVVKGTARRSTRPTPTSSE